MPLADSTSSGSKLGEGVRTRDPNLGKLAAMAQAPVTAGPRMCCRKEAGAGRSR
jgi:hypothetical protein